MAEISMADIGWFDAFGDMYDHEVIAAVNRLGFDKYGRPTAWGHDFARWFLSGGREEFLLEQCEESTDRPVRWNHGRHSLYIAANREDRAEMERQMAALGITDRSEMFYRMLWGKEDAPATPRRSGGGRAGFQVRVTGADHGELERQMHVSGVTDPTEMFRRMLWDGARLVCAGGILSSTAGGGGITGKLNFDTLLTEPVMDHTVEAADTLIDIARLARIQLPCDMDWPGMTRYGYGLALAVARRHMSEIAAGRIPVTALDRAEAGIGPDDRDTLVTTLYDVRRFFKNLMGRPMDVAVDGGVPAAGARPAGRNYRWFTETYAKNRARKLSRETKPVTISVRITDGDRAKMRRQMLSLRVYSWSEMFRRMLWGYYMGFPTWEAVRSSPAPEPEGERKALGLICTISDRAEMDRQMRELHVNDRSRMFRMLVWANAASPVLTNCTFHQDKMWIREEIAGLMGIEKSECKGWPDIGLRGHGLALVVARNHLMDLVYSSRIPMSGEDARAAGIYPYGGEARLLYMDALPEFFGAALGTPMRLTVADAASLVVVPNNGGVGVG